MIRSMTLGLGLSLALAGCAGGLDSEFDEFDAESSYLADKRGSRHGRSSRHHGKTFRKQFKHRLKTESVTIALPSGDEADVHYPKTKKRGRHNHRCRRGRPCAPFPVVAVLAGGLVDKGLYSMFSETLASYGFVVVVPNHYQQLVPGQPPGLFTSQRVVPDVLAGMVAANEDEDSVLHGIVDTDNMGMIGHSFGGAATLFTVQGQCSPPFCFGPFFQRPPELKAAVTYGTHTFEPQSGQLLDPDTSAVPVMMIQGELDDADLATATYGILEPAKALNVVQGLNHYGITNIQNPPTNTPDPEVQTMSQRGSTRLIAQWTALWLRTHLLGDEGATELVFESSGVGPSTVVSEL